MTSDAVLSVSAVSKTYGQRKALNGVSLSVAKGEMVALIGPSGSGKSTLLRAMTGFVAIDAGDGRIDALGRKVQARGKISDDIRQVRSRICVVFQQFNLVGRLTLFTNAALGGLGHMGFWRGLFGRWSRADKDAVMGALHRVGVSDYAGQRAATLSGGQQQRGAIARALVQKADIILADEPVASLDPVSARRVMELLCDLNRDDGISVVVTLHQVDYAMRYCSRVVALKAGRVVYDGPSSGLARDQLIDIYGPEIEEVFWEGDPK
ncbi:phosphonate ABC transporter ATP-binding protein [Caulobacter sp. CCUG 60055]|uniref:phosphonate ABC transporter ATP-binding protein n=1 Tax=Caulobacter sp. CCUG 60055 TaxID=2100090 RepID=UPI001FA80636|nr:phosphonate ABC transporter ATP-binding protein [Caulobacter sp. CCUG 60055]MCI3179995.1 phosphonate ABC transporter ATP-binding protein [Caulobacter sp. CCUG 60055]